jgi:hypothetical protein
MPLNFHAMKKSFLIINFLVFVVSATVLFAQLPRVIVSEYYNANFSQGSTTSEEWNELIVVQDNLDMRGWIVSDNNTAQEIQQGGVRFKNIDFWKNVRAGTIIGIWHRDYQFVSSNRVADKDTNMADGRIMLSAMDDTYFERYSNTSASWLDVAFNVAIDGDIIQVLDNVRKHVHALGHRVIAPAPGTYWTQMDRPKANTAVSLQNGSSNRFYPGGNSLTEYDGNPGDPISYAGSVNVSQCRTLPNYGLDVSKTNWQFWHQLRRPTWNSPTLTAVVNATSVSLTWSRMEDPNPSDNVQGYLVVRDSGTTPFVPIDGRIYRAGERVSNAVILQVLPSATNTLTDAIDLPCGTLYTYRVFAYRYSQDDQFGVNTDPLTARGRQYNKVNVAFTTVFKQTESGGTLTTNPPNPPNRTISFCEGQTGATITGTVTAGNAPQWMLNGVDIEGETNSTIRPNRSGEYRLKQRNAQGCFILSDSVLVVVNPLPQSILTPNTATICTGSSTEIVAQESADLTYQWLRNGTVISGATDARYTATSPGSYLVQLTNKNTGCVGVSSTSTVTETVVDFTLSQTSLTFPQLDNCTTSGDLNSLRLKNNSTFPITLNSTDALNFSVVSPAFPVTLTPNQEIPVTLRFSTLTPGSFTQDVSFTSQQCNITKKISLTGDKQGTGATLTSDKPVVDFGVKLFCDNATNELDVTVTASDAIQVQDIVISNNNPNFSLSPQTRRAFSLGQNASETINVIFNKLAPVPSRADLEIRYTSGSCSNTQRINLRGIYTLPQLTQSFTQIDFGSLDSCNNISKDTSVFISNLSDSALVLNQFSDPSLKITELLEGRIITIPARDSVKVTLKFSPVGFTAINNSVSYAVNTCLDPSGFTIKGSRLGSNVSLTLQQNPTDTINIGTIATCNASTLNQVIDIAVSGNSGATLSELSISDPNSISLSARIGDALTNAGQLRLTFDPTKRQVGAISEIVSLTSLSPCPQRKSFILKGLLVEQRVGVDSSSNFSSKKDTFAFGDVLVPNSKTITRRIVNTGSADIIMALNEVIEPPFFLESVTPPLGSSVKPQDTVYITIRFAPTISNNSYSKINKFAITSICNDELSFSFLGNATERQSSIQRPIKFSMASYRGTPGVTVPISIDINGDSLDKAGAESIELTLTYNTSLLRFRNAKTVDVLDNFSIQQTTELGTGLRIRAVSKTGGVESLRKSVGKAISMDADILLGSDLSTPLTIDTSSIIFTNSTLSKTLSGDGLFELEGGCNLASRLLSIQGRVQLMITSKQPTDNTLSLDYETVGTQATLITLHNLNGEKVATLFDGVSPQGVHHLSHPISEISQGAYIITLTNGSIVKHQLLSIIK